MTIFIRAPNRWVLTQDLYLENWITKFILGGKIMASTGKLFRDIITVPTISKNGDYPAKIAKVIQSQDDFYVTLKPYLKSKKGVQKFASILFKIESEVEENSPQSQFMKIFKHADSEEDIVDKEIVVTIKMGHSAKGSYPNIMKVKTKKVEDKTVVSDEDEIEEDEELEIEDDDSEEELEED